MKIHTKPIDFRRRNLVFIDLEMTGLDPSVHEILEIGCVIANPELQMQKTYVQKVKPERIEQADPVAIEMVGYTPEKWKDAIALHDALQEVNELASDAMFAGWNLITDWLFLERAFLKFKIEPLFDYHFLDAMTIAYTKFKNLAEPDGLKLRKIADYYKMPMGQLHGALDDATTTYEIFKRLMEK